MVNASMIYVQYTKKCLIRRTVKHGSANSWLCVLLIALIKRICALNDIETMIPFTVISYNFK